VNAGVSFGSDAVNPVPKGLLQCALYLRKAAARGAVVLASAGGAEGSFVPLSERRALLDLGEGYAAGLAYSKEAVAHRLAVAEQLRAAASYQQMRQIAKMQHVDWYLETPEFSCQREPLGNQNFAATLTV
jgi:hypothetical protein